jgi:3-hydroxyacyl-[acyl-carrier-protein] dehydratase
MAEEYLGDHFPHFPVMPGVLMLEAITEAGAWLTRVTDDFAHSMVLLRQANNIKYGSFVEPGHTLTVTVELLKTSDEEVRLKAKGTIDGRISVGGRLVLAKYNLADSRADGAEIDRATIAGLKRRLQLLWKQPAQPSVTQPTVAQPEA